jgi:hypothetical protein
MKVAEFIATDKQVFITLEPEHPAEIALLKLMGGCQAKCDAQVETPKDGLLITCDVKNRY